MNREEVEAIAHDLKVRPEDVLQMEGRLGGQDVSFSATSSDDDDVYEPEAFIADLRDDYTDIEDAEWQDEQEQRMHRALVQLDDRSRDILTRRWLADEGDKAGLQVLGDEYGVSAERIRQIESAAMKKLRKAIEVAA